MYGHNVWNVNDNMMNNIYIVITKFEQKSKLMKYKDLIEIVIAYYIIEIYAKLSWKDNKYFM